MCHQNCCVHLSADETVAAEESLLIYCKPVELYNILHSRAQSNPAFLRRCLRYKMKASRKRRLAAGVVIFNYRDYNNKLQKTEVTEDFSCPFCLMMCLSFKGLRYHLCSSHDLLNFEFWVNEEYQAVNVSVKIDRLLSETIADGVEQRQQSFFFWSRRRKSRNHDQNMKQVSVQFLELESINEEFLRKDDGENGFKSSSSEKDMHNSMHGAENYSPENPNATELIERVASSSNILGFSIAKIQSPVDSECAVKSQCGNGTSLPTGVHIAKARRLTVDRVDPRNRALLQKRQFYHSHRVQPMALEEVLEDRDSEDEVDDDIADFEDRRMLDDFVDVSKDEKQLMHLWNSFVRKQRVLADGHVSWACEAFSKFHGQELVRSPALFWCWRLFMIKLWNHGLLDASTMNNCNIILERCRDEVSGAMKTERGDD
ncbi:polycomb group protein EMBRYONIC FLOWER 2-like isoform X2 [Mercurialis annua]|uniref:polycomb group protein EMBRYONIC FLOWER 2-like isoform X2 n=1 Tax=Mercurialis annua TaxID=3986 RepID=UPI002160C95F|nr:polycomb group protein EMBRYONIC FLOWER 2-like isoform X2 [Mercurialis annua]